MLAFNTFNCSLIADKKVDSSSQSYAAFIPNEVFFAYAPSVLTVYACLQFLSFFKLKCSVDNIAKHTCLSNGTIRNSICLLKNEGIIKKYDEKIFLFKNHKLDISKIYLTAKEMPNIHLGYWYQISTLSDENLNNFDVKLLSFIKNFTKTSEKQIDMGYIGRKLNKNRRTIARSIFKLEQLGLLKRRQDRIKTPYFYQTEHIDMSAQKVVNQHNLSTEERNNIDQCNHSVISDCHHSVTYNNNINNKYIKDISNIDRRSSNDECTTDSLSIEKTIEAIESSIDLLSNEKQKKENELIIVNENYTNACMNKDIDSINNLRARMANVDISHKKISDELKKARGLITDYDYCIKNNVGINLSQNQYADIGATVKRYMPKFNCLKTRKKAFCLLMNSVICDIKYYLNRPRKYNNYLKSYDESLTQTIEYCLNQFRKKNYQLNSFVKQFQLVKEKKPYTDRYHWIN